MSKPSSNSSAPTRKTLAVCLEEEVYSPVSYIRLVRHLQDLKPDYRISLFVLPRQLPEALEQIPRTSLLLMARNRHESSFLAARKAAECAIPILCDVDDYVWEYPDYSKIERHPKIYVDEILALAACVATPSEDLANLVRQKHPGSPTPETSGPVPPPPSPPASSPTAIFFACPK